MGSLGLTEAGLKGFIDVGCADLQPFIQADFSGRETHYRESLF